MKLGIVAQPAPAPWPVIEPHAQATHDRQITAARRARLAAAYPRPAAFRRALRAVLRSPS